jgi:glycosyltransferase involved in cell wall biosynthesis
MKRIGLYLQATPMDGGVYQYSTSILEAISVLPRNEFEAVMLYSDDCWRPLLENLDGESKQAPKKSFLLRAFSYLWRELHLPAKIWRKTWANMGSFHRAFADAGCDYWIFPSQESETFMLNVNAIGVVHDLMHRYESRFPEVSSYGKYRRREYRYKSMCRTAHRVLVDSETGRDQLEESYGITRSKISVLPFVPPGYMDSDFTDEDFNDCYTLPDKYFFYPAQIWKHKNHEALIRAAARLSPTIPDIHLVFAGTEKNNYEFCAELAEQLNFSNSITFLGYVPTEHMPELYRRARALVMPTFFGPTNIPPLEAFSAGCPVAISDVYGIRDQVGDAALLFDPKNLKELETVLSRLWSDDGLCEDLVQKGFEQLGRWGQSQFNEKFLEILREL